MKGVHVSSLIYRLCTHTHAHTSTHKQTANPDFSMHTTNGHETRPGKDPPPRMSSPTSRVETQTCLETVILLQLYGHPLLSGPPTLTDIHQIFTTVLLLLPTTTTTTRTTVDRCVNITPSRLPILRAKEANQSRRKNAAEPWQGPRGKPSQAATVSARGALRSLRRRLLRPRRGGAAGKATRAQGVHAAPCRHAAPPRGSSALAWRAVSRPGRHAAARAGAVRQLQAPLQGLPP